MAKKITEWLLISLILTLGFGQLLRFEYLGVTFYLHDLLISIIILLNLSNINKIKIPSGLKIFFVGLILAWLHVLFLYPTNTLLIPSLYSLRLLTYLSLYFILKRSNYRLDNQIFVLSGVIMVAIGLAQYVFLPDMRWAQYLGWDDHLNRLILPHFDPTFTGVMLVLAFLSQISYHAKNNLSNFMFTALYSLPVLLTYARSVYLSLALTLCLVIKQKKILFITLILLAAGVIALPKRFGEGTNLLRTYSVNSRLTTDLEFVDKYGWQLIVGRGLNTLPLDMADSRYPNHATGPNNSYLYILNTTGLLGLIGWGIWLKQLYQDSSYKPMLIFFFVTSLFNNVMLYPFALLWVLFVETLRAPTEV